MEIFTGYRQKRLKNTSEKRRKYPAGRKIHSGKCGFLLPENLGRSTKKMKMGRKISQKIRKKSGNICREKGKMFIRKGNSCRKMRILLLKKTVESFKNYGNGKKSFLLHTKKDLKDIRMARKDIPEKRWRKQKKQIFLFKKS